MKIQTISKEKKQLHFKQTIYVGKAHFHQVKGITYMGILFKSLCMDLFCLMCNCKILVNELFGLSLMLGYTFKVGELQCTGS